MPRIFKFTQFSLRDLIVTAGPMALLVVLLCYLAYRLVDPTPPRQVTFSTGQENSAYEQFGKRYKEILKRYGIDVTLQPSLGSQENLRRLNDPDSGTDIAFVQSGSTEHDAAERAGLVSLGSLFTEPVWLFFREKRPFAELKDLKGRKVNVGPEGTGVPRLFKALLSVNGIEPEQVHFSELEDTPATVALLNGRIDALVFSSAPDSLLVQMLLQTPGIKLFDFSQAEAYSRRLPYLTNVTLPRGIVDLGKNLPTHDYHLVAPTATLVARENLHPALVDLFAQAATTVHGGAGWFSKQGEFPNARYTEIPVVAEAEKFYREGPPFLQRYMPFWLANFMERMWVVIVALGALFLPLSRILPPLYVWKVRSRVYRWYAQLRSIEQAIEEVPQQDREEVYPAQLRRLAQLEERVNQIVIPLSFADELYRLRSNINLVRKRIIWLSQTSSAEPQA
ncbi:TAXI family TRAP transporter solute-binding subunit [uncultured Oxalicibacterium sp.]|uniref:TAXI family TRAP transporter solute-binding subunit n=1 Tax=uncultured Oxalicibacterium sp. TaxID=1168540 RepID=UPI0025EAC882|nr:TAXI family TRAP transporter solute-binding subunit [uncultured Oxalicibacterium sp.]